MAKEIVQWKNRIVGEGEKPAGEFVENENNWRVHPTIQREALASILGEVGWVQRVIVNRTTGRIVDGHARVKEAFARAADTPVPFIEVDLTEEEEKKILLTFDPIGAMAQTDQEKFKTLSEIAALDSSALLEVTALTAAETSINTIEIEKESHELGELMKYLSFGNQRIPLTDDELRTLEERYKKHVESTGTNYGFIATLLDLE